MFLSEKLCFSVASNAHAIPICRRGETSKHWALRELHACNPFLRIYFVLISFLLNALLEKKHMTDFGDFLMQIFLYSLAWASWVLLIFLDHYFLENIIY